MVTHGMILCAGLGTRLKPFTDSHPKALAMINGKSLLQRNVEYLQCSGIYDVIVNVHHFAEQIIETVEISKGWGSNISFSDETDAVLETGGGLQRAAWFFEGQDDFVLLNCDILTDCPLDDMIAAHQSMQPLATLATTGRNTSRYFIFDAAGVLCGWRNVVTGDERIVRNSYQLIQKAFSGLHVISSSLFSQIRQRGKFSMVDVYLDLAKAHVVCSFDHSNSKFIDVGKPESIALAEALFE